MAAKQWMITVRNRRSKAWYTKHAELAKEVYRPRLPWYLADMWK